MVSLAPARRIIAWVLAALVLASCASPARMTLVMPTLVSAPAIRLDPAAAGPNQQIRVDGSGFPAGSPIAVRIEPLDATRRSVLQPLPVARIQSNGVGAFKLLFTLPAVWSDGTAIADTALVVVAGVAGGGVEVGSALVFAPAPPLVEAAAAPSPEPAPTAAPSPAGAETPAAPPETAQPEPAILVQPASGPAGAPVRVMGSGFPPSALVVVRLGVPDSGANERVYAQSTSDGEGRVALAFEMPGAWPDGRPITENALLIVASAAGGLAEAIGYFAYAPQATPTAEASPTIEASPTTQPSPTIEPSPTTEPAPAAEASPTATPQPTDMVFSSPAAPDPLPASIQFLSAIANDPYGLSGAGYLSQRLQAEIRAGRTVLSLLNLPSLMDRFEVAIISSGTENVLIQATLYLGDAQAQRTLLLIREGENWRVDGVQ